LRGDAGFGVNGATAPDLGVVVAERVGDEGGNLLGEGTVSRIVFDNDNIR